LNISTLFLLFLFHSSAPHRDLHSFPTRRSSDLHARLVVDEGNRLPDYHSHRSTLIVRRAINRPTHHPQHLLVECMVRTLHSTRRDRKSTRLNSSHVAISYAVFCLKKKKKI